MSRITATLDEHGCPIRFCADDEVKVLLIQPSVPDARVYQWTSLRIGEDHVDNEIGDWPIGDVWTRPRRQ
jgi:hypothetical protein